MMTLSAMKSTSLVLTPLTVLPSIITSSTGVESSNCTPISLAISPILVVIEPRPPFAWNMPCSYSKNANIVNKDGAWNGLIPRYFVWKDIARRTRSSSNNRSRSEATLAQGFSTVAAAIERLVSKSEGPFQGD